MRGVESCGMMCSFDEFGLDCCDFYVSVFCGMIFSTAGCAGWNGRIASHGEVKALSINFDGG